MERFAIAGCRIYPVSGPPLEKGTLVVGGGKIREVRPGVDVPEGIEAISAEGMSLIPGLVEAHCHVGLSEMGTGPAGSDGNEFSLPVGAELRALDGIHPGDPGFDWARREGITTLCVLPGSSDPVGGEAVVLKAGLRGDVDAMVLGEGGGLKMALGENPKRQGLQRNRTPMTRMAIASSLRQALEDARHYAAERERADEEERPFRRDLRLDALARVLAGETPARFHAHRADDVATALRLADEFGLRIVIEHGTGAASLAERLAWARIPVVYGPALAPGTKVETRERDVADAVRYRRAGVEVALTTDAPVTPLSALRLVAALAVREGMDEAEALCCITLSPARILGVADRVGSLEPGKDADLVLLAGDPLDARSRVVRTWIDGDLVHEASGGEA